MNNLIQKTLLSVIILLFTTQSIFAQERLFLGASAGFAPSINIKEAHWGQLGNRDHKGSGVTFSLLGELRFYKGFTGRLTYSQLMGEPQGQDFADTFGSYKSYTGSLGYIAKLSQESNLSFVLMLSGGAGAAKNLTGASGTVDVSPQFGVSAGIRYKLTDRISVGLEGRTLIGNQARGYSAKIGSKDIALSVLLCVW